MAIPKQTETQLVRVCLEWLSMEGVLAWRQNTGAWVSTYKGKRSVVRYGIPGMSDILGVLPDGRFLAIECKLPGREATIEQERFHARIDASGGLGIVVHTLDELQDAFERLDDEGLRNPAG
ncbi:hypothetical protein LCGC14_1369090 [marine sediment metagenome]|uniref:VRR-NUC domain-containing protein n=1 Tax=marine sediment metagenome TaxID=412755 RepID=A0A0F9K5X7_9ZZZZ